jgi:hypothetical protein
MTDRAKPVGFPQETFLKEYGDAVVEGNAAVFIGAGMSLASGYVDWKGLLADFADELGLDLDIETDLVSVAQYHLNENENNRNRLSQKIVDEFSDAKEPTESHLALAKLPIGIWWTTNYDDVVERGIKLVEKKPQVIATPANVTVRPKGTDALVNKMHGDLSNLENIIITGDDYEDYVRKFPGFRTRLESDLSTHTFLFLGYSFSDPHFDFILSELRRVHGPHAKTHYAIMRREALVEDVDKRDKSAYAARRQELRIKDLMRYGIQTILVDDHDDIPDILRRLRQRYLRRHVFVAGAQVATEDPARSVSDFSTALGKGLIEAGYNLVSGLGLGVGGAVVFGALDVLYTEKNARIDRRLQLWPFPQEVPADERAELYSKYRQTMLATVGFAVVVAGSKLEDGAVVPSSGTQQEVEIAADNKAFVIPVGRTGHIAAELWAQYDADPAAIYGTTIDLAAWATLNDESATDGQVVAAVIKIMDGLRPQ